MEANMTDTVVESTSFTNVSSQFCSGVIVVFERPASCILIVLIAICVLGANSLNLVVLRSTPSLRNVHGYLLTALTAGGLGIGCIAVLMVYPVWVGCWPYGEAFCLASAYAVHSLLTYNLCVINLLNSERYIAIVHPLRYRAWVTKRRTLAAIFITLLVSLTLYLVPTVMGYLEIVVINEGSFCVLSVHGVRGIPVSLTFMCVVIIPSLIIICFTSVVLLRKVVRRSRRLPYLFGSSRGEAPSSTSCSPSVLRGNTRLFIVSILLMMTYFVWWIPYFAVVIVHRQEPEILDGSSLFVALSFLLVVFVSPMCNTIIYMSTMKVFQERAKALLIAICCYCCSCPGSAIQQGRRRSRNSSRNESEVQTTVV